MDMRTRMLVLAFPLIAATPAFAVSPVSDLAAPIAAIGAHATAQSEIVDVAANDGAASQAMIERLGKMAMDAITDQNMTHEQRVALFRKVLGENFDMPRIARFAAGKYWRQATPAQQQEYTNLYQQMVVGLYSARFNNYSGQQFSVVGNRVDESGDVIVTSSVTGKGAPVNVDWRVRPEGGTYRIIDVMVEGVSMAVTQRNDFAGVIQQGGGNFDALIAYLKQGGTSDVKN